MLSVEDLKKKPSFDDSIFCIKVFKLYHYLLYYFITYIIIIYYAYYY